MLSIYLMNSFSNEKKQKNCCFSLSLPQHIASCLSLCFYFRTVTFFNWHTWLFLVILSESNYTACELFLQCHWTPKLKHKNGNRFHIRNLPSKEDVLYTVKKKMFVGRSNVHRFDELLIKWSVLVVGILLFLVSMLLVKLLE